MNRVILWPEIASIEDFGDYLADKLSSIILFI